MLPELVSFIFAIFIWILRKHNVKGLNFFRLVPFGCPPHEYYPEAGHFYPVKQLSRKVSKSFIGKDNYLPTIIDLFFKNSDILSLVE